MVINSNSVPQRNFLDRPWKTLDNPEEDGVDYEVVDETGASEEGAGLVEGSQEQE